VEDVGAEKGIIVSKMGFQSGAFDLSSNKNIDLVTFRELRSLIQEELPVVLDKFCSQCKEWVIDTTTMCPQCGSSLWKHESQRSS